MNSNPIVLIMLLALGIGRLLLLARDAETRSRKLGLVATACGITGFIPALLGPGLKEQDRGSALVGCGLVMILLAVVALGLVIWTFRARRRDHGVGLVYPLAALICGTANLFCGIPAMVTGSRLTLPPNNTEAVIKVWRSEKYGFEVTLPSEDWRLDPNPNVLASFRYPPLRISGMVAVGLPGRPLATYQDVLAYGEVVRKDTPTTGTIERSGVNPHGNPFWVYMGEAKSGKSPYFFGLSVTRVGDTPVLLMFEGQYQRQTEGGRAEESRLIRVQAETFLNSVK